MYLSLDMYMIIGSYCILKMLIEILLQSTLSVEISLYYVLKILF